LQATTNGHDGFFFRFLFLWTENGDDSMIPALRPCFTPLKVQYATAHSLFIALSYSYSHTVNARNVRVHFKGFVGNHV
jgi:hypothetical protein